MRILLLGAPGAGKGTQARILADSVGVPHIASGDLFRKHEAEGTDLGHSDAENGYILDGFPRTLPQAEALDQALAATHGILDRVDLIEVSVEDLIQRLSGRWSCGQCQRPYHEISAPPTKRWVCDDCGSELHQRADDQPEAVARRLEVYQIQTEPLIEHYEKQGRLTRVDGQKSIDQVAQDLLKIFTREPELIRKIGKLV
jgi:adenylate kinase